MHLISELWVGRDPGLDLRGRGALQEPCGDSISCLQIWAQIGATFGVELKWLETRCISRDARKRMSQLYSQEVFCAAIHGD